ncbi:hypothetical protein [Trueperella sp.]|uniref:hypothetical protein n=1 Tax=Trueperella sp. TaxID=2699835 RepID=UPI00373555E5
MRRLRDSVALVWLIAALFVVPLNHLIPASDWLLIHLILLGALTHSAMVWSEYFAHTLLKTRATPDDERAQDQRIGVLGVGALLVLVGFPADQWLIVLAGALFVAAAMAWHIAHLLKKFRAALPGRFRVVIRYYVTAACMLPIGATFGAVLAFGVNDEWRGRLMITHMVFNLLGWIGLTVIGTLLTFWPTMIRARMDPHAEKYARQSYPLFLLGIAVMSAGALSGVQLLSLVGLATYTAGLVWWGRALIAPLRQKGLVEFAPTSVGVSMLWASVGLVWVGYLLATSTNWSEVTDKLPTVAAVFVVGFALQLLLGALSYLIPMLIGRGPAMTRAAQGPLNAGGAFRIIVPNVALLVWLAPVPDMVRHAMIALALITFASFFPVLVAAIRAALAAKEKSHERR